VEVWQACASGRYHHRRDPNPAAVDPDFQYYCSLKTDKNGNYRFRTIRPGKYPAAAGWDRPPHIHFKVRCKGYPELVTQMYFEGDSLNLKDDILLAVPKKQRELVVVAFEKLEKVKTGRFDIILNKDGRHAHLTTPILP
jgi:protocatechuate 3,4-dioxygenase beta subunit